MSQSDVEAPLRLILRRTFAATRERVFDAFSDPAQIRRWIAPAPFVVAELDADVRVGGTYRVVMQGPEGERLVVRGAYTEIVAPERISYTWSWEEDVHEDESETLVTVTLVARGAETDLVITHDRLGSEASRDNHERGWTGALDQLEALVTG